MSTMSSQFTDLTEFLARHNAKNNKDEIQPSPTHTRIGGKHLYTVHLLLYRNLIYMPFISCIMKIYL